tara:strand:+ start:488 stop:1648 length:1161 start_codon:yes stop_codon:yes gene_type:complete
MNKSFKIKIIGAGPTGTMLAIALCRKGHKVTLYDLKNKTELIDRDRAYALTQSSMKLLGEVDLLQKIRDQSNSFEKLVVWDTEIDKRIEFKSSNYKTISSQCNGIGSIIEHSNLMKVCLSELSRFENINLRLGQSCNDKEEKFDYVIAADGIKSTSRSIAKIKAWKFTYKQACLTCKVLLRGGDPSRAYEILRREGPFAVLPIGGDVYQIVWSAQLNQCVKRVQLSKSQLLNYITSILPTFMQADSIIGDAQIFPINFFLSRSFIKGNLFLIGEAAHSFHPVGGQGLNLCWRDITDLTRILDLPIRINRTQIIPQYYYNIKRLPDVLSIGIMTHLLVRIFSNNNFIILYFRRLTFYCLKHSFFIRKSVLNLMTYGINPNIGFSFYK